MRLSLALFTLPVVVRTFLPPLPRTSFRCSINVLRVKTDDSSSSSTSSDPVVLDDLDARLAPDDALERNGWGALFAPEPGAELTSDSLFVEAIASDIMSEVRHSECLKLGYCDVQRGYFR